jgi:hypothetical protein
MGWLDTEGALSCCDGCGRLARTRIGWTQRAGDRGIRGLYCRSCTGALRTIEMLVRCSACGRHADEAAADRNGWGYLFDGRALVPHCAACLARTAV